MVSGRQIDMNTRPGRHPPLHKERLEWKVPSDSPRPIERYGGSKHLNAERLREHFLSEFAENSDENVLFWLEKSMFLFFLTRNLMRFKKNKARQHSWKLIFPRGNHDSRLARVATTLDYL